MPAAEVSREPHETVLEPAGSALLTKYIYVISRVISSVDVSSSCAAQAGVLGEMSVDDRADMVA